MLDLRHVTVTRDDGAHTVVRDVSLQIQRGELVTVVGATAAGKSTLLRLMAGLMAPTNGDVMTRAAAIGVVLQDPDAQLLGGTVEEDVAFGLESIAVPSAAMGDIVAQSLAMVDLGWAAGRSPATMSGGERQRVALAGAIAQMLAADGPALLVLDEPTSHLDPAGRARLTACVHRLMADTDTTVVWATQDAHELAIADRTIALEEGALAFDGAPADLLAHPGYVDRLGLGMPDAARVAHELADRGVHLTAMPVDTNELVHLLSELRA